MFFKKYAQNYDLLNSDKPYQKEIEFVYEWAEKPRLIFDIGCGTASYWKYYPKTVHLLGVDKSRSMAHGSSRVVCADITKYKHRGRFDCATALFDVLNYIPRHNWWGNIPVEKGGFFIFDIWDKNKVKKDGFETRNKKIGEVSRKITPIDFGVDFSFVDLKIDVSTPQNTFSETHRMFLYDHEDILGFCGNDFEVLEVRPTEQWQTWYKCRRK